MDRVSTIVRRPLLGPKHAIRAAGMVPSVMPSKDIQIDCQNDNEKLSGPSMPMVMTTISKLQPNQNLSEWKNTVSAAIARESGSTRSIPCVST